MLDSLPLLPVDPILGLIEKYKNDANANKIDLGVGVYRDESGATPVFSSVKRAEHWLLETEQSKAYVGPAGNPDFNRLISDLVLGESHPALKDGRVATVQTPGGCGALRVAAELIVRAKATARIWVSNPTWGNHVPLLGDAGLTIQSYPYYNFDTHQLDFEGMLEGLSKASPGDLVLLHACCHNPSGADLSAEQWRLLAGFMLDRQLVPFIDMAYQGFGDGLEDDRYGLSYLAENLPEVIFAISCSKNFGLYRERVGAVGVVSSAVSQTGVILSQLNNVVRGIYSMPPSHGASVVARVLMDEELQASWVAELQGMRLRIVDMRNRFCEKVAAAGCGDRFAHIANQKGMFSFLGLSEAQVHKMAADYSVYMVDSSRISLAGLRESNIDYFVDAVINVI
ncbi:amino acid aminotransferase [Teredinibacter sp. KSP-S5-2]|uniref:amino acid aminotransferase n=1 Tax=Teredinibacter sp. KSP-S5-2 TaxID=3034506 RepID=UPI002934D99B|nr:amino acid aminotransferase [Teredinibacter sp. KSP-S5-2]WNO11700.1 aspartate/tyrosine/aromatic aminotransferase [Teredinibacter sp. KSP-S5-2]